MKVVCVVLILALCVLGQSWTFASFPHVSFSVPAFQGGVFRQFLRRLTGFKFCGDEWPPPQHVDPESKYDAVGIVRYHGYPAEEYVAQTDDGYLLTMVRIPYGVKNKTVPAGGRPVALLQHGLLDSCVTWISNAANESLAYVMADAGFDVWLGNVRGNTYAKRHIKYHPSQLEFWKFSWDQMARFDLPAMINLALKISKQPSLFYVGHSQGTMIAFSGLSINSTVAAKVRAFYALGPVTTVGYIESPIRYIAPFAQTLAKVVDIFGRGQFLPSDAIMRFLAHFLCGDDFDVVCSNVVFLMCGYDCKYTNLTRLPVYVAHTPAGTSAMNMVHFAQGVMSGKFLMYNYGREENMKKYHQPTPPEYNLTSLRVPTALIWGQKDWLADPHDVKLLIPKVQNLLYNQYVSDYNHLDFVWGYNARIVVYEKMVKSMKDILHW